MYKKILVPLDGSMLAEKALPYAIGLAKRVGAKLVLVRAVEGPGLLSDTPSYEAESIKNAEEYMARVARIISRPDPLPFIDAGHLETMVVHGDPAKEIARIALEVNADLILMSTHGRGGLSRLVMGSVAGKILHHSIAPVMLVRPFEQKYDQLLLETLSGIGEPFSDRFEEKAGHILLTLDGSELAEAAIEPAIELASRLNETLYLLTVNYPVTPVVYGDLVGLGYKNVEIAETEETHQKEAYAYLEQVARLAEAKGVYTVKAVKTGSAALEIVEYTREINAQVIVMATHAPGALSYLFLGSVAEDVMRHSHLPVLMIPATIPAKESEAVQVGRSEPVAAE